MIRAAFRRWLDQRLPETDTWLLTQRNVYILPTRAGIAFALVLLLMLVAAINYQLNLGYVLTFLLAGAGLVSMHLTHGTLRGLTLHLRAAPSVFAGEAALLEIVVTSPGGERHALAIRHADRAQEGRSFVWTDVPAAGSATVHLTTVPARRGWHAVPRLVVETVFPFGLFRAWTVWRPAARVLAWPHPEAPPPPLPPASPVAGERPLPSAADGGELDGVRSYRRGDALRRVLWKKVAKSGQLVSRETHASGSRELWLDWTAAAARGPEERLSRLAAWIQAAERAGLAYGLSLPGRSIAPGSGDRHRRAALDLLATWSA